ncbi:Arm DNA-binding domain-containing protein [Glaciimonas sp. GNP009]
MHFKTDLDEKMPKLATPLTDIQVKSAKPKDKAYTLADGGMYLEVSPVGSKIWRMAYRQPNGKNTRLTFGASSPRYVCCRPIHRQTPSRWRS